MWLAVDECAMFVSIWYLLVSFLALGVAEWHVGEKVLSSGVSSGTSLFYGKIKLLKFI